MITLKVYNEPPLKAPSNEFEYFIYFNRESIPHIMNYKSQSKKLFFGSCASFVYYKIPINKVYPQGFNPNNAKNGERFIIEDTGVLYEKSNDTLVTDNNVFEGSYFLYFKDSKLFGYYVSNGEKFVFYPIDSIISDHITDFDNPHVVTKEQVGLGKVTDNRQVGNDDFRHHAADIDNPHNVNNSDIELGNVVNEPQISKTTFNFHITDFKNPHNVTKEQAGLGDVENFKQISNELLQQHILNDLSHIPDLNQFKIDLSIDKILNIKQAKKSDFDAHVSNSSAHGITKEQVGLKNVDNKKQAKDADFKIHMSAINPHVVTSEDIDLKDVPNIKQATPENIKKHFDNIFNPHDVTKKQLGLEFVTNDEQATEVEFFAHVGDKNNPHRDNPTTVGLGNVVNYRQVDKILYNAHVANHDNPHNTTNGQVGLGNVTNDKQATKEDFDLHVTNYDNPHKTNILQIGLDKVLDVRQGKKEDFDVHANKVNPHGTTKEQIGLGSVDNTSDMEKPISNILGAEVSNKLQSTPTENLGEFIVDGKISNSYISNYKHKMLGWYNGSLVSNSIIPELNGLALPNPALYKDKYFIVIADFSYFGDDYKVDDLIYSIGLRYIKYNMNLFIESDMSNKNINDNKHITSIGNDNTILETVYLVDCIFNKTY